MDLLDSPREANVAIGLLAVVAAAGIVAVAAPWPLFPHLAARVLAVGALLAAVGLAFLILVRALQRARRELDRRNRELQALQQANLDIYGELSLEAVLQRVVERAAQLLGARYGALLILGEDDQVEQFVTSGVDEEQRRRIGEPPVGRGLLGVGLDHGDVLRLADVAADPRSGGVPPHHPDIDSLLAVPVPTEPPFRANLYLGGKTEGSEFSPEDESTLLRFADQAALAIEKALLHRQLESVAVAKERERIAREMHDGMAQVLAYVNTKAQAVREYVAVGKTDEANRQLEQLAAAARDVLTEVREGILALRADSTGGRGLCRAVGDYLAKWSEQTGIVVESSLPPRLALDPAVEIQLLRIVQEALSNVRKHSGASRASVTIEASRDGLLAVVEDRGVGFDETRLERRGGPRFGLAIMRERAESVGASLAVESVLGRGTRVQVELPGI